MIRAILMISILLSLAGCATPATEREAAVVIDTFCSSPASRKRVWNPETDSIASMRDAVTHNRYVDLRCRAAR
jgi:hypothetical protein